MTMTETRTARPGRAADGRIAAGAADWLGLAATPTFAAMALLTSAGGSGGMHAGPSGGMALMYLLMGAFHAPPWLRLISRTRPGRPT